MTRIHTRAHNSTRTLLPELLRYKDTVRCGKLGTARTSPTTTAADLDYTSFLL